MRRPLVTAVRYVPASPKSIDPGLIAFLTVTFDDSLQVGGITLRRTLEGKSALSFPRDRDQHGTLHAIVRPLDAGARRDIEEQIFAELRRQGRLAS